MVFVKIPVSCKLFLGKIPQIKEVYECAMKVLRVRKKLKGVK